MPSFSVIEIQKALPTAWIFCIIIPLSQRPLFMCKCWCLWSTPKLPTITMKISWNLMANVFLFPPPTPHSLYELSPLGSWSQGLISPRLNVIQSMLPVHWVRCTICRYVAQRHRCVNSPVFTVSTEAINLGWILREASICADECFLFLHSLRFNFCLALHAGTSWHTVLLCGTIRCRAV